MASASLTNEQGNDSVNDMQSTSATMKNVQGNNSSNKMISSGRRAIEGDKHPEFSTIAIICTKHHEFNQMEPLLKAFVEDSGGELGDEFILDQLLDVRRHYLPSTKKRLLLATFGDDQGPVHCSIRVGILLRAFDNVEALFMPGICGGTRLGRVIVAERAKAWDQGRRVYENGDYVDKHEYHDVASDTCKSAKLYVQKALKRCADLNLDIVRGSMISVTKVRDDAYVVISEHARQAQLNPDEIGVEMESFPFYELAQQHGIKIALVIKGTSDSGWESFDPETVDPSVAHHNCDEMKKVKADFRAFDDNSASRRDYRKIAAQNAARVVLKFVEVHLQNKSVQ